MARSTLRAALTALALVGLAACATDSPGGGTGTPEEAAADRTAGPTPVPTVDVGATDPAEYAAALVAETNRVRAQEGLAPLVRSACAEQAAVERAADLVGEKLTHAPLTPVIEACTPHTMAAENLVDSDAAPAAVVDAWLGSAGHRNNLLAPDVTEIGVGCVQDADEILCAQIFLGP